MVVLCQVVDWQCTCSMCMNRGPGDVGFNMTYNSAKHSIRIVGLALVETVADIEVALSSSARTATMTAAIS